MSSGSLVAHMKRHLAHGKTLTRLVVARFSGTFMQFVSQVVAGRLLGAEAVGILGVAQGYVLLFGAVVGLGAPTYVLRRTVKREGRDDTARNAAWLQFGVLLDVLSWLPIGAGFFAFWIITSEDLSPAAVSWLGLALVLGILGYAVTKLFGEHLKGHGRAGLALNQEFMYPYVVVLIACVGCIPLAETEWALIIPAMAFSLSFLIMGIRWTVELIKANGFGLTGRRFVRRLRNGWGELIALMIVVVGNRLMFAVPVSIAFILSGAAVAGYLAIILKLTGLLSSLTAVFAAFFAPRAARAHRSGNRRKVLSLFFSSALLSGSACAVFAGALLIFPAAFLRLFGPDFVTPETILALQITSGARLIRQFFSLSDVFLSMTGLSQIDAISQAVSILLLAVGLFWLAQVEELNDLIGISIVVAVATTSKPLISSALFVLLLLRPLREYRLD